MINLLPKSKNNLTVLDKIRHLIFAVTTLVIVIFVVSVVSILAINFYQNTKDRELTGQINNLNREIDKLSSREARIRQIDLRQKSIDKFLANRPKVALELNSLNIMTDKIIISSWDYKLGKVGLISSSSADLQNYSDNLKVKFAKLQLDNTQAKGGTWISILALR